MLAMDATDSQTLYAATSDGVFRTVDGAASWAPFDSGLVSTFVNAVADIIRQFYERPSGQGMAETPDLPGGVGVARR